MKNNTSYKNFDALFSKYFTKIYRVFNFRTEELRTVSMTIATDCSDCDGRDLALAQLAPSAASFTDRSSDSRVERAESTG